MNTHPRCSVPNSAQHQATGSAMPASPGDAAAAPDAELIALCAEFDALQRRITAFYTGGATSIADDDQRDAVVAPLKEQQQPLADRICALRATTAAGLRARAETLALYSPETAAGAEEAGGYCDDRMVAALVRDLTGMAAEDEHPAQPAGEVLALRRRFMAINARCADLDTFEDRDKAAFLVATERRAALDMVLLTTAQQTLADVAALMVAGFDKTQDLEVFPTVPGVVESVAAIVMRVFALSLPIVAAVAGVPLGTIVTEADQARHDRCLVPMEAVPQ